MSNSALDEFLNRKKPQTTENVRVIQNPQEDEATDEIDYRAFGVNRNRRQAVMLDVRTLTGTRLALSYLYLNSIFFDASGVIVLSFGSQNIRIEGRNLAPVYEALLNHSVRFIQQENADLEKEVPETETFISAIEIGEPETL